MTIVNPQIYINKRHEEYPAFQKRFFTDVTNLFNYFKDIYNPFEEDELIVFRHSQSYDPRNSVMS